jgi:nucleoside-diphosphate-sugar epimerase
MNVFIAGGSGAIGVPLIRQLVAAGHQVTALTRSASKAEMLRALGATAAVADALDAAALRRVVVAARPTHVIHQLTALPQGGPKSAKELAPTNRLRIEGTRNLIDAAAAAGVKRFVVGSFAPLAAAGSGAPSHMDEAAEAMRSMESQALDANARHLFEAIILRYGLFYGPDNAATNQMIALARRRLLPAVRGDNSLLPWIHLHDAASATVAALEHGIPGRSYDIVDDHPVSMSEMARTMAEAVGARKPFAIPSWILRLLAPYLAQVLSLRLPLSNAKARAELGWRPAFPNIREGSADVVRSVAARGQRSSNNQPFDSTSDRSRLAQGKPMA